MRTSSYPLISKIIDIKNNLLINFYKFIKVIDFYNSTRKGWMKRYVYTINHKQIAINYLYFSMFTGLSGAALATFIRMELAMPGSLYFRGDSLRYLQVITAHGLIMVFFVVVPILFGCFANFLIPYHVGSKDVAFPRLNSIGFWIQPCGYLLIAKIAFLRPNFWKYYDKPSLYLPLLDKSLNRSYWDLNWASTDWVFYTQIDENQIDRNLPSQKNIVKIKPKLNHKFDQYHSWTHHLKNLNNVDEESLADLRDPTKTWMEKMYNREVDLTDLSLSKTHSTTPRKLLNLSDVINSSEAFIYLAIKVSQARRKKIYFSKCSDRTLTVAGWAFVTPFSSNPKYTNYGSQDLLIIATIFAGISTTISFTNLLITRRTLSMPGFTSRRSMLPFITISLLLTMRMLAVVTPVLGASMFMLLMDRHWQTTFFEFVYGGDTILFQHLFWFFGHPEVYILILPTFGFVNMVLPSRNIRRIASKQHLIWAIYIMAYMGFIVWGHHMYLVGLDHRSRSLYSTITIMISLPATIKMVNWTLTLLNGALRIDVPLAFSICYILVFITGGFTGMWLSHVGLNISMHDTFYVIAHFHLMLSGATLMGCFLGVYYYFTSLFGVKYSRNFAYLHLLYYFGGQWLTFLPMFWLGFAGLPRRYHDYPIVFAGWHSLATSGHLILMVGIAFFFITILDSFIEKKVPTFYNYGVPRFYKRGSYYIFKIYHLHNRKNQYQFLPSPSNRQRMIRYSGEIDTN